VRILAVMVQTLALLCPLVHNDGDVGRRARKSTASARVTDQTGVEQQISPVVVVIRSGILKVVIHCRVWDSRQFFTGREDNIYVSHTSLEERRP